MSSVLKKADKLNLSLSLSLLGVMETWLKDDDCDLCIEGYDKLEKHRQNLSGGGVAIF